MSAKVDKHAADLIALMEGEGGLSHEALSAEEREALEAFEHIQRIAAELPSPTLEPERRAALMALAEAATRPKPLLLRLFEAFNGLATSPLVTAAGVLALGFGAVFLSQRVFEDEPASLGRLADEPKAIETLTPPPEPKPAAAQGAMNVGEKALSKAPSIDARGEADEVLTGRSGGAQGDGLKRGFGAVELEGAKLKEEEAKRAEAPEPVAEPPAVGRAQKASKKKGTRGKKRKKAKRPSRRRPSVKQSAPAPQPAKSTASAPRMGGFAPPPPPAPAPIGEPEPAAAPFPEPVAVGGAPEPTPTYGADAIKSKDAGEAREDDSDPRAETPPKRAARRSRAPAEGAALEDVAVAGAEVNLDDNVDVSLEAAYANLERGQLQSAWGLFDDFARRNPRHARASEARLRSAEVAARLGWVSVARAAYREVIAGGGRWAAQARAGLERLDAP